MIIGSNFFTTGTAFPSPMGGGNDGDLVYRTDQKLLYTWDATTGTWLHPGKIVNVSTFHDHVFGSNTGHITWAGAPTTAQGTSYVSFTYSMKHNGNNLQFRGCGMMSLRSDGVNVAGDRLVMVLIDTTNSVFVCGAGQPIPTLGTAWMVAMNGEKTGVSGSITFDWRIGRGHASTSGRFDINGEAGSEVLQSMPKSYYEIREYAP